jgi:hypothetical protein
VSVPFTSVALSFSLTHGRDLSHLWVVESAISINLTAFRSDFAALEPSSGSSRVRGVGVDVMGSGIVQIATPLCLAQPSVALSMRCIHCRLVVHSVSANS